MEVEIKPQILIKSILTLMKIEIETKKGKESQGQDQGHMTGREGGQNLHSISHPMI